MSDPDTVILTRTTFGPAAGGHKAAPARIVVEREPGGGAVGGSTQRLGSHSLHQSIPVPPPDPAGADQHVVADESAAGEDAPTETIEIPRQIGSVRLIRQIGRGGMGVVWLGRDDLLRRDVAVKFLLNAVASPDDPGFESFLEGARAAAALRHPNLTAVHTTDLVRGRQIDAAGERREASGGIPYIVMEFVDGPTLSKILRDAGTGGKRGGLTLVAVLAVLEPVCDAVGALHEQGIVHRDIKPSNILLQAKGSDCSVFVTDFGLSVSRPASQTGHSTAAFGVTLGGTPSYMAPELFDGIASARTDVYALGIMAYELLLGKLPFGGGGDLEEIRRQQREDPLPTYPMIERGVKPEIVEVLERATNKDSLFRYKTASHFIRAFRDVAHREGSDTGAGELASLVSASSEGRESAAAKPGSTTLAGAASAGTPESGAGSATSGSTVPKSTTYYDTLSSLAVTKRRDAPPIPPPEEEPIPFQEPPSHPHQASTTGYETESVSPAYPLATGRPPADDEPLTTPDQQTAGREAKDGTGVWWLVGIIAFAAIAAIVGMALLMQ